MRSGDTNSDFRFLGFSLLLSGFLILFSGAKVEAANQFNVPDDKVKHFSVSAAAQTTCSTVGRLMTKSKWGSTVTCFVSINAAGALKELWDPYRGGTRDETDIYANLTGSGLSMLFISVVF